MGYQSIKNSRRNRPARLWGRAQAREFSNGLCKTAAAALRTQKTTANLLKISAVVGTNAILLMGLYHPPDACVNKHCTNFILSFHMPRRHRKTRREGPFPGRFQKRPRHRFGDRLHRAAARFRAGIPRVVEPPPGGALPKAIVGRAFAAFLRQGHIPEVPYAPAPGPRLWREPPAPSPSRPASMSKLGAYRLSWQRTGPGNGYCA